MILLHNAAQLVTPETGRGTSLRIIENASLAYENGQIVFIGSAEEGLASYRDAERIDATGKIILPGFVDSHTHLVFAGDRCEEFLMKLRGATYQEIAAAGGGILSTVEKTRAASRDHLEQNALLNLERMLEHGTTTVEVKSGYGLNWETEEKLLTVAQQIKQRTPQDVIVTFLGAHDFPREIPREKYMDLLMNEMIPQVAGKNLAEFCDVFCDEGYYTVEEARAICLRATGLGLRVKLHVDELADVDGAALAAEVRAVSADHLIFAKEGGIAKMAEAGVVAVLLPGTSFGLKMRKHAPAREMIRKGVKVAIATDFNPGTCYCHSMQQMLQLAAFFYSLTPEEAITAATLHGAAAIQRDTQLGSLEISKQADCLIFDIPHYAYLFYNLGVNRLETVIKKGKVTWSKKRNLN